MKADPELPVSCRTLRLIHPIKRSVMRIDQQQQRQRITLKSHSTRVLSQWLRLKDQELRRKAERACLQAREGSVKAEGGRGSA